MKEYKHSTKAGNHGDVLKHVIWLELLTSTMYSHPEGCLFILDTHGGNGNYNILSDGGEYYDGAASGIARVMKHSEATKEDVPPPIQAYLDTLLKYDKETTNVFSAKSAGKLQCYPGSPMISQRTMHPNAELVCFEINEMHCKELWERLEETDNNTSVFQKDGLDGAPAILRKVLKRKRPFLAIMDPPYVSDTENQQILESIEQLYNIDSNVSLMLWIPIFAIEEGANSNNNHHQTKSEQLEKFHQDLMTFIKSKSINCIVASLWVGKSRGMIGSRTVILNPPTTDTKLASRLDSTLMWLAKTLEETSCAGKSEIKVMP